MNTQDLKILASDFMSSPLSRGIADCEKVGESLFDATQEIERLTSKIKELESSLKKMVEWDIKRTDRVTELTVENAALTARVKDLEQSPTMVAVMDAIQSKALVENAALAAQNQQMREYLTNSHILGYKGAITSALALPDLSTEPLERVKREAHKAGQEEMRERAAGIADCTYHADSAIVTRIRALEIEEPK